MCIYTRDISAYTDDLIFTAAHIHISSAKIALKIWQSKNKKKNLYCWDAHLYQFISNIAPQQ